MAKSSSKSKELHYAQYKTAKTFEANKKRKLSKLLKKNPNNLQLVKALSGIRNPRSAPKVPKWSHTAKADAQMFASFKKAKPGQLVAAMPKQPFSLAARAHTKDGTLLWV